MRYWLDTEFIEDGKTIDLLSIGIVAEDGREFYAENGEADKSRSNQWVRDNVLPHLRVCTPPAEDCPHYTKAEIAERVAAFCDPETHSKPEFWGYYADYDWVVLCQLFGRMIDLPKGWPMYCRDLKQWCDDLDNPVLPEQGKSEHHALADARWNHVAWDYLNSLTLHRRG